MQLKVHIGIFIPFNDLNSVFWDCSLQKCSHYQNPLPSEASFPLSAHNLAGTLKVICNTCCFSFTSRFNTLENCATLSGGLPGKLSIPLSQGFKHCHRYKSSAFCKVAGIMEGNYWGWGWSRNLLSFSTSCC